MSDIFALANAITNEINRGTYPIPLFAITNLVPRSNLKTLNDLTVQVVPFSCEYETATRVQRYTIGKYEIGVQQSVKINTPEEIASVAEAIAKRLYQRKLADFPKASFIKLSIDPLYIQEHLLSFGVYTTVIAIEYKWVDNV